MISLDNITLMRGTQTLLEDVSLVLHNGQRAGVIGRNGCGKSSLFAALNGGISLEQGKIEMPTWLRRSTMAQETPGSARTAVDFVIDAHTEYRRLEAALLDAEEQGDDHALARLHGDMENIAAYDINNRAEQLLSGLGFATDQFDHPVSKFSGGWRVRLNLAAALMCPSDLLMLDEPTNHLDLEATVWLEQWLQRYEGTILMISHDRTFLDSVINRVISFENGSLVEYKGNYSAYEVLKAERLALQKAMYEKQQRRRAQVEDFVRRFRAKASKARQAQSRLKELGRMQDIAPAHADSPFRFHFPEPGQLPAFLMQLESLAIGYDAPLVENINLGVRSESRIGLLGFNGSGKSTLLKVLAGQLPSLAGEITSAKKIQIGYFAQHQVDELDQQATPVQLIQSVDQSSSVQEIRDFLGGFDFRGSRVDEVIVNFSGGEKARLALAKVTCLKPNLLLLDEPTNHLDLEMCHALTVALQEYQGAMIVVSHDRHLLANTVDEFYSIHRGRFKSFDGDLHDYEKWLSQTEEASSVGADKIGSTSKVDKKQQRQQAAAMREQIAPLKRREKNFETKMDSLHKKLSAIEESLGDEKLYAESKKLELTEILQRQGLMKSELEETEEQWLLLQDEIAQFE